MDTQASDLRKVQEPARPLEPTDRAEGGDSLLARCLEETLASRGKPDRPSLKPIGFRPWEISSLINAEVVARHADSVPFLWLLRDQAVAAPHYSLKDLAELDERVEAHLDGLCVARDYGWRLCEKALDEEEAGEVFAAGVLALEGREPGRLDRVLRVALRDRALQRGLISAAGWVAIEPLRPVLRSWIGSERPALRRVAAAVHAVQRVDPGRALLHLLYDDDQEVRARAMKAAAELGRVDLLPMLLHLRSAKDPECRFFAAWASARLGDRSPATMQLLQEVAAAGGPHQERALTMVVRCLPLSSSLPWLRQFWKHPGQRRLAAQGLGAAGDPALAGVLIEWMEDESLARVAGEAFSLVTGADLKYLDLNQDPPAHPDEDNEDSSPVPRRCPATDRELPYPAQEEVAKWWRAHRDRFEPGQRYLCGLKIEPDNLRTVLIQGQQHQRTAAALELALQQSAKPLFEVRAPGGLQQRRLEAWTL